MLGLAQSDKDSEKAQLADSKKREKHAKRLKRTSFTHLQIQKATRVAKRQEQNNSNNERTAQTIVMRRLDGHVRLLPLFSVSVCEQLRMTRIIVSEFAAFSLDCLE